MTRKDTSCAGRHPGAPPRRTQKRQRPLATESAAEDPPELERLLTVGQVAALLSKSEGAIRRMVYRDQLPAVRVGKRLRFKYSAMARYLEELPKV